LKARIAPGRLCAGPVSPGEVAHDLRRLDRPVKRPGCAGLFFRALAVLEGPGLFPYSFSPERHHSTWQWTRRFAQPGRQQAWLAAARPE